MILTIQLITVDWTKFSRGAPQSDVRNSVAENYPVWDHPGDSISLQEVSYSEFDNFQSPKVKWRTGLNVQQLTELRLVVEEQDKALLVSFWGPQIRKRYKTTKKVASFPNRSFARIRGNARYVTWDSCGHQKQVYNISWTKDVPAGNLFSQSEPSEQYDDLVQLY